ncbi:MAG: tRNA lysidine(34) synthetase TilS, partial [Gammaproteobacteria bacterium]|nr:tRNA lysidine(34) synthetase TilS [Gammaproteobacteria bacterium]
MKLSPVVLQQMLEGLLQHPGDSSASPLSKSTSSTDYLFSPTVSPLSFVVGLSGGVDSIVLLHALSILSQQASSESDKPETKPKLNFKLKAIHVNHQLQFEANEWQKFCVSFCETLNIPIQCFLVDAVPKQGEGPEAAARNARYDVFKKKLLPNEILLTAHHLDDQIETVLLQMLRGTGVDGGAGIRPVSKFNTSYLIRPLLMFSRDAIEAYANENSLTWINDPSNTETYYDRNYLRHDVLPAIEKRWPSYRDTIGRFSQHMRQASELLNDIADQDLEVTNDKRNECLLISELNRLSFARKNNLIRHWLSYQNYSLPSDKQLKQINALIVAREDAMPVVSWGNVELRRFHGCLYSMNNKRKKIPEDFCENISEWKLGK